MSYIGYVVEELMHGRQTDVERLAAGYGQRHAARTGRQSRRRARAARSESGSRTAPAAGRPQAGCAAC
jgi:hypothetical protein